MIETFPDYPAEYGGQGEVTPRVLTCGFGDNYSQRTGDGLNTLDESWPLTFNGLKQAGFEEIRDFLEAHGGYIAFYWTIPRTTTPLKWIARKWTKKPLEGGEWAITTTFQRVYDL
jgi:phage-related protein